MKLCSVIKTTDGGTTWIDKSSGIPYTNNGYCLTVEFIDANTDLLVVVVITLFCIRQQMAEILGVHLNHYFL